MYKTLFGIILIVCSTAVAYADTLIKMRTIDGQISEIMSNNKKTRIGMPPGSEYALIDHDKQTVHFVNPDEQKVLHFDSDPTANTTNQSKIKIKLESEGNGPKIAGYKSKIFKLLANEQPCGYVFGSKKALKNENIQNIFNAINIMMEKQRSMMGGFIQTMDACDLAEMEMETITKIAGLPLKTLDRENNMDSEIISIDNNANVVSKSYALPKNYQVSSVSDEMNQAKQQMQQQMPELEQMMKQMQQMQQSGQVPPQAIEQMEKMQEMMQQFQQ